MKMWNTIAIISLVHLQSSRLEAPDLKKLESDRFIKQFGLKQAKLCLPKLSQATLAKYVANLNCPLCNFQAPDLMKEFMPLEV